MKKSLKNVTVVLITIMVAILSAIFLMIVITNSNLDVPISSIESEVLFVPESVISEEKTRQDISETHTSSFSNTDSSATISTSTPPTNENLNNTTSSSGKATVVQMADPETGISWDGVSPIIYTYPDGTTGTEKRDGATYEQVPGMFNTVVEIKHVEYNGKCSDCGKTEGDGTNGSCVQWLMGDVDCPHCGVHVSVRTCHTCGE